MNLDNPVTFNEKITWQIIFDDNPLKTQLADKYLVRSWIAERIGMDYLIPLLGVWDDPENIEFDQLPDKFVLKTNHGCGWNIVIRDKKKADFSLIKEKLKTWMGYNFADITLERQYKDIVPKVICEELLESGNEKSDIMILKFFVLTENLDISCI